MSLTVCSALTDISTAGTNKQYSHEFKCLHLERDIFYQIIQWVATGNTLQEAAKNVSLIGQICKGWHVYSHEMDPARFIDFTYDQGESQKICNILTTALQLDPMSLSDFTSWIEKDENAEQLSTRTSCRPPKNLQLGRIPSIFAKLTHLDTLTINMHRRIYTIPNFFASLNQLMLLKLSNNTISVISTSIGCLPKLELLALNNNKITEIPEFLSNLTHLKTLNLNNNNLTILPNHMSTFTSLQYLHVSNNDISDLPPAFGELTQLKELRISNNPIPSVPDALSSLTQLESLFVNNTAITDVSNICQLLPKLTLLYHRGTNNVPT